MPTVIPDVDSEAIAALYTGVNLYAALFNSSTPGKTGTGEITGTGYVRQLVATAGGWSAAGADVTSGGIKQTNAAKVDFGTAGSAWGAVGSYGFYTAVSGGTFRGSTPLTTALTISSGTAVYFNIGDLVIVGAGF